MISFTRNNKYGHSPAIYIAGLFFIILIFSVRCLAGSKRPEPPETYDVPVFEIYPYEEPYPEREIVPEGKLPLGVHLPKIAIIIDDIGYDAAIVKKFLSLDAELTYSIFPACPFQDSIIQAIQAKGGEMMLHLPMEPVEYPSVHPGPEALFSSMPPEQFAQQLEKNLERISFIKGVNNHMGSRITAMSARMYQILSILKKKDLFFIDSFTNPESICQSSARILQIPFARRDVFLDHTQKADSIREQIHRLIRAAEAYGEAVGIGHPHNITYEILKEELPLLQKKVQIVPASRVVHTIG